ncbi:MAG: hypothetical protein L3J96_01565, partial [Thermoplasmata archaeon]|nr:hypothetical protein [Thermoplasmata archaeon]
MDRVEVVPISHSDDPSLLTPAARPMDPANRIPPPPPAKEAAPAATFRPGDPTPPVAPAPLAGPPVDLVALKAELERNVARWVESRLAQIQQAPPGPSPTALGEEIDTRATRILREQIASLPPSTTPTELTDLENRLLAQVTARVQFASQETLQTARRLIEAGDPSDALAPLAARLQTLESITATLNPLTDRISALEAHHVTDEISPLAGRVEALESRPTTPTNITDRLAALAARAAIVVAVSERLTTLERQDTSGVVNAKIEELLPTALAVEVTRQLGPSIASRWTELERRLDSAAK